MKDQNELQIAGSASRTDRFVCAYVGPSYDFVETPEGYLCPKCRHGIAAGDPACEILGTSARCSACGREMVVSPERAQLSRPAPKGAGRQP